MIERPRLKTFLTVFPLSTATWGVKGSTDETWRIKLTDERAVRAFSALLPYLDGRLPTSAIVQSLADAGVHTGAAQAVFRQLESAGLLEDADTAGLSDADLLRYEDQIRYFSRFTQHGGAKYQAVLGHSRVAVVGHGSLAESVCGRIAAAGFGDLAVLSREPARARAWIDRLPSQTRRTVVHAIDPEAIWPESAGDLPHILIACQETHDPLLLEAIDALSKQHGLAWLLVRGFDTQEGWVGPLFVPGESASYLSLQARLRANMPGFQEYTAFDAHVRATEPPPSGGGLKAACDLLASIAAIEAITFVTEIRVPSLLGKFVTINMWTWETEVHEVLRLPALDRVEASRPVVYPWKVASA